MKNKCEEFHILIAKDYESEGLAKSDDSINEYINNYVDRFIGDVCKSRGYILKGKPDIADLGVNSVADFDFAEFPTLQGHCFVHRFRASFWLEEINEAAAV